MEHVLFRGETGWRPFWGYQFIFSGGLVARMLPFRPSSSWSDQKYGAKPLKPKASKYLQSWGHNWADKSTAAVVFKPAVLEAQLSR